MTEYYKTCAFPKPQSKKKKIQYNGWKDKADRVCYYCGQACAERHEVYAGMNRQNSIREGFQVDLCNEHHREIQDNVTDWAKRENRKWKRHFQAVWLKKQVKEEGLRPRQAVDAWMSMMGKNFIEELPV